MFVHSPKTKTLAYGLIGVSVLISLMHVWYPLTITSPNPSDRTGFAVTMAIFSASVIYGYRWARITLGVLFTFCAAINSMIALAYAGSLSSEQLFQIVPLTLILGATGILFLKWKGVRVFEEERERQKVARI